MKLLDGTSATDYRSIDKKAYDEWAYRSFDDKGWRSYFAYEDMKILKELSFGKERDQYMQALKTVALQLANKSPDANTLIQIVMEGLKCGTAK